MHGGGKGGEEEEAEPEAGGEEAGRQGPEEQSRGREDGEGQGEDRCVEAPVGDARLQRLARQADAVEEEEREDGGEREHVHGAGGGTADRQEDAGGGDCEQPEDEAVGEKAGEHGAGPSGRRGLPASLAPA